MYNYIYSHPGLLIQTNVSLGIQMDITNIFSMYTYILHTHTHLWTLIIYISRYMGISRYIYRHRYITHMFIYYEYG